MEYSHYTIEPANSSYGDENAVIVYAWGVYPRSSVLAGQQCKKYMDQYDSVELALKEYPKAEAVGHTVDANNTFNHLPSEPMTAYEEENYFHGDDE
tara:strand:+ start:99 stop:386 length:288 start_codon:yes stop_codon:yes gene_type:complete